jgi:transcriptional regulator with XRE-family HTH domain
MQKKPTKQKLKHPPLPLLLKPRRNAKGWTQEELAHRMGVSDATIVRVEQGKQNWKQEFLQEAARVLECHWLDLLPLEEDRARARDMLRLIA